MKSIPCPLAQAVQKFPHHIALQGKNFSLTYAQWEKSVREAQQHLLENGISKEDRIALLTSNRPQDLHMMIAAWRIGAVVCLLPMREPQSVIKKYIKQLNCKVLAKKGNRPSPRIKNSSQFNPHQLATIIFSSGSTGAPKMIVHTLGNHYDNARGANQNIPVTPDDRWLLSLPIYHVSGLSILFRILSGGGTIVFPDKNKSLLENIRKFKVTIISVVPTQLIRLLQEVAAAKILRRLKAILLGGAPIPTHLLKICAEKKIPIYQTYGLSEMASQVATAPKERVTRRRARVELSLQFDTSSPIGSVAGPALCVLPYRKVHLAKDSEILVRGSTLFSGYWTPQGLQRPLISHKWFPTGDIGKIWEEKGKQFLTITGRKDNMFISGGENIYPEEIEKCLTEIEGIEEAVVVPQKNKEFGFLPAAFIKFSKGKLSTSQLRAKLQRKLPSFKIPRKFLPWPKKLKFSLKISRSEFQKLIS
ncbi:MAG: o-succinylbenzoate--CoA ligase [Candidatus Omnitrophica bacterium]|nr:o-succinylbenzoate--CoA ligase [Candidatus Omnitrophota bacterium]